METGVLRELVAANPEVAESFKALLERANSAEPWAEVLLEEIPEPRRSMLRRLKVWRERNSVMYAFPPRLSPPMSVVSDHRYRARRARIIFAMALLVVVMAILILELNRRADDSIAAYVLVCLLVSVFACVVVLTRAALDPLSTVTPPDPLSALPLTELENLAARSVLRLRSAYRLQLGLSIAVAAIIGAAFVWSLVMVTIRRLNYATAFGAGGMGATVMAVKWQPFDRVGRARDLAEQGDVLATGLRVRMATIAQIADPKERHNEEWRAVKEYTAEALGVRRAEVSDAADVDAAPASKPRARRVKRVARVVAQLPEPVAKTPTR